MAICALNYFDRRRGCAPASTARAAAALVALFAVAVPVLAHQDAGDRVGALTGLLEAAPKDPTLWLRRAHALLEVGVYPDALADLDEARRLGGEVSSIELIRARVLLALGESGEAEAALDRALRFGAEPAVALHLRARARSAAGRHREASTDLERLISIVRPTPELVVERLKVLQLAGDGAAAVTFAESALESFPSSTALRREVIALDVRLGRHQAALVRLAGWIDDGPLALRWQVLEAEILEAVGPAPEACEAWRRAAEMAEGLGPRSRLVGALVLRVDSGRDRTTVPCARASDSGGER